MLLTIYSQLARRNKRTEHIENLCMGLAFVDRPALQTFKDTTMFASIRCKGFGRKAVGFKYLRVEM
jgi:hypothetical protein